MTHFWLFKRFLFLMVWFLIPCYVVASDGNQNDLDKGVVQDRSNPYRVITFKVGNTSKLNVISPSGNVTVKGVPGDSTRIELYIRRGLNILSSDKSVDDFRIQIIQKENEIFATVENKRSGAWSTSIPQFNFIIYTTTNTSVNINTMGGNIEVDKINGDHRILSNGGNVSLDGISGTTRINNQGGSTSISGHRGELRVRTIGGGIHLDDISGTVLAKSVGGSISAELKRIDFGLDLEAIGGSIRAQLPGLSGLDMNVIGQQVNLNRIQNFIGEIKKNSVIGKLNGGGLPVNLKSTGGSVDLVVDQGQKDDN